MAEPRFLIPPDVMARLRELAEKKATATIHLHMHLGVIKAADFTETWRDKKAERP